MSRVSQSAGQTAVQLLGTVTTTANAISTAVNAVGNAFDVLNVKSNDWLTDTKIKSAALAHEREEAIIDEISFSIANRLVERDKILSTNPLLKGSYDKVVEQVRAKVEDAKTRM